MLVDPASLGQHGPDEDVKKIGINPIASGVRTEDGPAAPNSKQPPGMSGPSPR
ncbi:hypothetical protein ACFXDI_49525 [Streptomyces mirabilis]|uniref:hypothetical protein n=1 Tax=Streptomyces mirabilis TaxID=68239 RepID=UPI0036A78318